MVVDRIWRKRVFRGMPASLDSFVQDPFVLISGQCFLDIYLETHLKEPENSISSGNSAFIKPYKHG